MIFARHTPAASTGNQAGPGSWFNNSASTPVPMVTVNQLGVNCRTISAGCS